MLGHLGDLIFITYRFGVHQCWQYLAPVLVVLILRHKILLRVKADKPKPSCKAFFLALD